MFCQIIKNKILVRNKTRYLRGTSHNSYFFTKKISKEQNLKQPCINIFYVSSKTIHQFIYFSITGGSFHNRRLFLYHWWLQSLFSSVEKFRFDPIKCFPSLWWKHQIIGSHPWPKVMIFNFLDLFPYHVFRLIIKFGIKLNSFITVKCALMTFHFVSFCL